jgi:hypothetical protein
LGVALQKEVSRREFPMGKQIVVNCYEGSVINHRMRHHGIELDPNPSDLGYSRFHATSWWLYDYVFVG